MKQITDIRELRQLQLAIIDDIHQFCEQNGIRYSLAGGTLIGAFRHQGYIPWDDDIDIYLMRSDYERFLKEYKDKNGRFQLLCPEQTEHYFYTFAKVIDTETVMIEDETEGYYGIASGGTAFGAAVVAGMVYGHRDADLYRICRMGGISRAGDRRA